MPSLFSTTLPPCGYDLQLAYQNVLHRIRTLYLSSPPSTPLSTLIHTISTALTTESILPPMYRPYRRPPVFTNELRWIKYFAREASVREKWGNMSADERDKQRFLDRMYPVPKELGVVVRLRRNGRGGRGGWEEWGVGKRGDFGGI